MCKPLRVTMITILLVSGIYLCGCNSSTITIPTTNPTSTVSTVTGTATTATTPLSNITDGSFHVENIFPDLSFLEMTNLVQPDDKNGLIFVTEQSGVIYSFTTNQPQQSLHVFLDITNRVNRGGNEEGLLGFTFDPKYQDNGYFYVYYSATNPRRSVVSRFSLDRENLNVATPQTEAIIMEIEQPYSNHNGGQLAFGPDGYLYIGLGDGGSSGDPQHNGQNLDTLLGKILRIDVNELSAKGDYKIPPDNPFVGITGARAEIWALGLRNPWRFSFDKNTGLLWAGDVGQNKWEEIDIIIKGGNYGWNIMEGFHCYSPSNDCTQSGLTLPLFEYDHSQGCSVTGGYVYRGDKIPSLKGYYIYGDYCSGNIWALRYNGNPLIQNILLTKSGLRITSFGEDLAGNIYILSQEGGIYTLAQNR